jgi:hypothetical protein
MTISYTPEVWDVRPDDASSLGVLPKLGEGDFQQLWDFMKAGWPEFDLLGTHGEDRAQDGERWWGIGAIEVKEGVAEFQIQFRKDKNTYDDGNILSLFHWDADPDDPNNTQIDVSSLDVHYYNQAVAGWSEGADSKGFPYGSESGPYAIWLNSDPDDWVDRRVGSDAIVGLHWFDHHVSLNAVFWPMRKGENGTPVPVPTGGNYIAVVVNDEEVWRGNFRITIESVG